jgi:hypothetical protein
VRPLLPSLCVAVVLAAALVLSSLAPACGDNGPPPAAPKKEASAQWQDVFDTMPDIYAVVRPQAIKRDPVYGNFWKALVRVAESRHMINGPSTLEAAEGSEEIIFGMNAGLDAAIVLRGVPASLDPQKVTDAQGHPLFRLVSDKAKVPEYQLVDRRNADPGSVFILPDRTWVGAFGDARQRARTAFTTPFGRPAPKIDNDALAVVRFGQSFVQQPRYVKSPVWSAFTKHLNAVTLALKPNKGGAVISLHYDDQDATAYAEMQAKQMVQELAKDEKRFGWLKDAKVAYEGNTVHVNLPLPARLLEDLPSASGNDIPL